MWFVVERIISWRRHTSEGARAYIRIGILACSP
jgi:hypothetical protein